MNQVSLADNSKVIYEKLGLKVTHLKECCLTWLRSLYLQINIPLPSTVANSFISRKQHIIVWHIISVIVDISFHNTIPAWIVRPKSSGRHNSKYKLYSSPISTEKVCQTPEQSTELKWPNYFSLENNNTPYEPKITYWFSLLKIRRSSITY